MKSRYSFGNTFFGYLLIMGIVLGLGCETKPKANTDNPCKSNYTGPSGGTQGAPSRTSCPVTCLTRQSCEICCTFTSNPAGCTAGCSHLILSSTGVGGGSTASARSILDLLPDTIVALLVNHGQISEIEGYADWMSEGSYDALEQVSNSMTQSDWDELLPCVELSLTLYSSFMENILHRYGWSNNPVHRYLVYQEMVDRLVQGRGSMCAFLQLGHAQPLP